MELVKCPKFGMREIHFKRFFELKGGERLEAIYTYGVDIGPHVYVKYREGDYEIWHAPAHQYWSGTHQNPAASTYYLIRNTNDVKADFLFEIEPGRRWAQGLELLKAKIDELEKSKKAGKCR